VTDRVANRVVATGHPGRRRHPSTVVLGLVLAGAVVVPACSSGDPSADPSTSPPASTSTVPPTTATSVPTTTSRYVWTPEQQPIVDTYLGWERAFNEAVADPDPSYADLARYGAGDLLISNQVLLKQLQRDEHKVRPRPGSTMRTEVYKVTLLNGKGYVEACTYDDTIEYLARDGSVIDDTPETRLQAARIESIDETFKVVGEETRKDWPGQAMDQCLRS
jgi:hypothetical protein